MKKSILNLGTILVSLLVSVPSLADEKPICAGDRVYDSSAGAGRAVEVYADGTAKINFDQYSGYRFVNVSSLGKGVRCRDNICAGDRAHDPSSGSGTVKEVFSNGVAKIDFDYYSGYYFRNTPSIGKGVPCKDGICVNSRVHDSSAGSGTVKEVFSDGVAKVDFDSYSGYKFRSVASLGGRVNCSDANSCIGKMSGLNDLLSAPSDSEQRKVADSTTSKVIQVALAEADSGKTKASSASAAR